MLVSFTINNAGAPCGFITVAKFNSQVSSSVPLFQHFINKMSQYLPDDFLSTFSHIEESIFVCECTKC